MAVAETAVGGAQTGNLTTPITWTHVAVAGDTELLVGISVDNITFAGSGVTATYNGVSMGTPIANWPSGGTGKTVGFVALFAMANPPSGSHTVSVAWTAGDAAGGGSVSYTGSASLGSPVTADSAGVAVTTGSIIIPTTSASNRAFAVVAAGSGSIAFTAGTQRYTFSGGGSGAATGAGGADIAGTGSNVTISWTQTSDWFGAIGVEIQAAVLAAPNRQMGGRPFTQFIQAGRLGAAHSR